MNLVSTFIKYTFVAFILLDCTGTNNNLIFGSSQTTTTAVHALGSPTGTPNISSSSTNEKNHHTNSGSSLSASQSSKSMSAAAQKTIKEICRKPPRHWVGNAFHVYPVFADKAFTSELSPFLMFDYAAPKEFPPEKNPNRNRRGVGQHPHRGFETVTVAFQGEVEHADSEGNSGVIGPGDVQWMTAARGIIHEEFHSTEFSKRGGIFEMFQLWVNLPSSKKMSKPRYQPILAKDIPQVPLAIVGKSGDGDGDGDSDVCTSTVEEGYAKIIAGNFRGTEGPAKTFTPVDIWVVSLLTKQKEFELEFVEGHTTLLFVQNGSVEIQGKALNLADVAIMDRKGTKLTIRATQKNTSLLILSGEPIDEPIAARGPFVMNTQHELQQAMTDYQRGTHGFNHFK
jgi:redox-sensitive bicupin YhaK (pirin superfamily)